MLYSEAIAHVADQPRFLIVAHGEWLIGVHGLKSGWTQLADKAADTPENRVSLAQGMEAHLKHVEAHATHSHQ